MINEERVFPHGRRSTDDLHTRLVIVENGLIKLEKDIIDDRSMTERMCNTLDEIKLEISGAKGFLKAISLGASVFVLIIVALSAIQWLKVPV